MTPSLASSRNRWQWVVVAGLMLVEFLAFERLAARREAMVYPRWSDQIQYLTESYQSYDELKAHGWMSGLRYAASNPAAQGTLHDIVAVFAFGLFGASRVVALDLNFVAFLAWQAVTLFAVQRISGSRPLGWLGFALLLCLAGPWSADAGSAVDFRLDHAAMCLWGIAAAAALLTRGFRDVRWSLAFGFATGLTVVERFLAGAYFAPIFLAAAVWILCGDEKVRRLRNLLFAGAVAFVLAAPFFWVNRVWIYNYYWMGHFANAESAARAPGLGLWGSLEYVGGGFADRHLGWAFGGLVLILTIVPLLLESFWDRIRATRPLIDRNWLFPALAFFLVPFLILCAHRQKSVFVLGIITPGFVLCLLWLWSLMLPGLANLSRRFGPSVPALAAGLAVLFGLGYFGLRQAAPPYAPSLLADSRQVSAFVDRLYRIPQTPPFEPRIGIDQIMDSVDGTVMRLIGYERHHRWMTIHTKLPITILAADESVIFQRLAECDFVFLTDAQNGDGYWPYDHQMRKLYPRLKDWCDHHLEKNETLSLFEKEMSLYQRHDLP